MSGDASLNELQSKVWQGSIPLHITLSPLDCRTYEDSIPYMIQCPRLSYLPFLLPRLYAFFTPSLIIPDVPAHEGWFTFDGVPLKWQHPIGLLYDLFSNAEPAHTLAIDEPGAPLKGDNILPWKLVLHFSDRPADLLIPLDAEGKVHHDNFINSVKEADFLRNGTGKVMMSLSKEDSTTLWQAVREHKLELYRSVAQKFYAQSSRGGWELRHVPVKIYLPTAAAADPETGEVQAAVRVVQGLVTPSVAGREVQTLGTALHGLLPTVFPSRRSYIHAQAVLHGAVVPLAAPVQELMQFASYADGFLHVAVVMVG